MNNKNEILAEARNLPPIERAQLIEALIATFDSPERQRLDKLWGAECENRIAAYEQGELTATTLDSVFEKIDSWKK
jgi:putative addiction module component (TIGR02574 family)